MYEYINMSDCESLWGKESQFQPKAVVAGIDLEFLASLQCYLLVQEASTNFPGTHVAHSPHPGDCGHGLCTLFKDLASLCQTN